MRQVFIGFVALVMACSDGEWPAEPSDLADTTRAVEVVTVGKVYVYPFIKVIAVGRSFRLNVVVRDTEGRTIADPEIVFGVTDGTIATVDDGGLVSAQAIGETTITVWSGSKSAEATITVVAGESDSGAGDWDY